MTQNPRKVGHYEIERELARGGMGVVYVARDGRLDRPVALKAISDDFIAHPERLARFEREARILASLNHPNIASVYGLEDHEGCRYLAMELVEGETLADRLARGPLEVDEAISICAQIAAAVEAAHNAGVIHRDLKPANVIVREDGVVKVLDFGLAREVHAPEGSSDSMVTATHQANPLTREGVAVGTPGYMSPEQARGRPVDRATDVFAFGCILYECLSGKRTFDGPTATDVLAAPIERDPDFTRIAERTPTRVRLILERCLHKDPKLRLRDIGDARLELETALNRREWTTSQFEMQAAPAARRRRFGPGWAAAAAMALLLLGVLAGAYVMRDSFLAGDEREPIRFTLEMGEGYTFRTDLAMNSMAVAPDGRSIAYIATAPDGEEVVHVRRLDRLEPLEIRGIKQPRGPTFSPDGRWLGLMEDFARFVRVPVDGGSVEVLWEFGAAGSSIDNRVAWVDDDTIVYSFFQSEETLLAFDLQTREHRTLASADPASGVFGTAGAAPAWPARGVLTYTWSGVTRADNEVSWVDVESGELRRLLKRAASGFPVAGRWVTFVRDSVIYANEFDFDRIEPVGREFAAVNGVSTDSWGSSGQYAVSPSGTLVYVPGSRRSEGRRLALVDRSGASEPLNDMVAPFSDDFAVSADGSMVAATTLDQSIELWVFDRRTGSRQRYRDAGEIYAPCFSPDGRFIYVLNFEEGKSHIDRLSLATGKFERVLEDARGGPIGFDGSGRLLLSHSAIGREDFDIVRWDPGRGSETETVIATEHNEWSGTVSPDGAWLMYGSMRSGRSEGYIRAYPDGIRDWRASHAESDEYCWAPDGSCIYYVTHDPEPSMWRRSFSVDQQTGDPVLGDPERLFTAPQIDVIDEYRVMPQGEQFLTVEPAPWEMEPARLNVIVNWDVELRRLSEQQGR